MKCEAAIEDKQKTIKKMKSQVEILDEEADLLAVGQTVTLSGKKIKPKKNKMCQIYQETGKCKLFKERKCPYAHNAIELDIIPLDDKVKNLTKVIQSQTVKMKDMKPLEPWRPAKQGKIEIPKYEKS